MNFECRHKTIPESLSCKIGGTNKEGRGFSVSKNLALLRRSDVYFCLLKIFHLSYELKK